MAFEIFHGAQSDVGRRRPHNEDRHCADPGLGLYVVCDGMGGGNAGEVASVMAVETIHRHYSEATQHPDLPFVGVPDPGVSPATNRLASAIRLANAVIYKSAGDRPEWSGMGTTVVAVALTDHLLSFAHVGDSRLYLVRNQMIQPLTIDHSWVAEQVRQGLLTEEEAERSPRRNIVTRALGVETTVDVTLGELPLFPDDRLLLCSDGLTKGVQPSTILDTLLAVEDAQTLSRRLVSLANEAGGEDNTTVIVLAVHEEETRGLWQRLLERLAI
jgi:protein phosphatase